MTAAQYRALPDCQFGLIRSTKGGGAMSHKNLPNVSRFLIALAALLSVPKPAPAQIFVSSAGSNGTIAEYSTSGAPINTSLVTGLNWPDGMVLVGSNLFEINAFSSTTGTMGEYTTSGATVNSALVSGSGLAGPQALAVASGNLFVANYGTGAMSEYTTSGTTVSTALITGFSDPRGIAVLGSDLFVINNYNNGTIGEYTTSGTTLNSTLARLGTVQSPGSPSAIAVNDSDIFVADQSRGTVSEFTLSGSLVTASLITGLTTPEAMTLSGNDLFIGQGNSTVGEYTTSGATVNAALITGILPTAIVVVPEPSAIGLLAAAFLLACRFRARVGSC
jgi:hypothetical protein